MDLNGAREARSDVQRWTPHPHNKPSADRAPRPPAWRHTEEPALQQRKRKAMTRASSLPRSA